jgi:hypothetical protein
LGRAGLADARRREACFDWAEPAVALTAFGRIQGSECQAAYQPYFCLFLMQAMIKPVKDILFNYDRSV